MDTLIMKETGREKEKERERERERERELMRTVKLTFGDKLRFSPKNNQC